MAKIYIFLLELLSYWFSAWRKKHQKLFLIQSTKGKNTTPLVPRSVSYSRIFGLAISETHLSHQCSGLVPQTLKV